MATIDEEASTCEETPVGDEEQNSVEEMTYTEVSQTRKPEDKMQGVGLLGVITQQNNQTEARNSKEGLLRPASGTSSIEKSSMGFV